MMMTTKETSKGGKPPHLNFKKKSNWELGRELAAWSSCYCRTPKESAPRAQLDASRSLPRRQLARIERRIRRLLDRSIKNRLPCVPSLTRLGVADLSHVDKRGVHTRYSLG